MYDKTDTDEKKLSKIETIELLKEAHAGNQKSREKAILNNVGLVMHQVNNNFKSAKKEVITCNARNAAASGFHLKANFLLWIIALFVVQPY